MLKDAFRQKRVTVERSFAQDLPPANVDGDKMRQVFLNLLRNAFEAVEEGGRISVALGRRPGRRAGASVIRISDNGCGIPEKDWENIFEPFFTTKSSGFGLGPGQRPEDRRTARRHRSRSPRSGERGAPSSSPCPARRDNEIHSDHRGRRARQPDRGLPPGPEGLRGRHRRRRGERHRPLPRRSAPTSSSSTSGSPTPTAWTSSGGSGRSGGSRSSSS